MEQACLSALGPAWGMLVDNFLFVDIEQKRICDAVEFLFMTRDHFAVAPHSKYAKDTVYFYNAKTL